MANAFFATALVYGLRRDRRAMHEWWQIATMLATRSSTHEAALFVARRLALHGDGEALARTIDNPSPQGTLADYARSVGLELAVLAGVNDAGRRLSEAQSWGQENPYVQATLQRAEGRLQHDPALLEASVTTWERVGARFERATTLVLLPERRSEGERELLALGCRASAAPSKR
jgi:hypothetical protein